MKLQLCAVGRLRSGPERDLVEDYLARFERTGRPLGLPPVQLLEARGSQGRRHGGRGRPDLEGRGAGATLVILDERGRTLSSPEFADHLAHWRDSGRDVSLAIGGADGLAPRLRDRADLAISLGRMVWPHMLVRVMLAEQLYRAATILAGSPYHRV